MKTLITLGFVALLAFPAAGCHKRRHDGGAALGSRRIEYRHIDHGSGSVSLGFDRGGALVAGGALIGAAAGSSLVNHNRHPKTAKILTVVGAATGLVLGFLLGNAADKDDRHHSRNRYDYYKPCPP